MCCPGSKRVFNGLALAGLAAPEHDLGALESSVRAAQARSVRKPASVEARLRALRPPEKEPE